MTARLVRITDPAVHGEGSIVIGVTADGVSTPWQRGTLWWVAAGRTIGVGDAALSDLYRGGQIWAVYL